MTFPSVPLAHQWTDLEALNAVKLNARIDDNLNLLAAAIGGFQTYAPTLTATTSPTGYTASGRYRKVGTQVFADVLITFGAGMTAGSGGYLISLPTPAVNALASVPIGHGFVKSAGVWTQVIAGCNTATTAVLNYTSVQVGGSLVTVGAAAPGVFVNGDIIRASFSYESA